PVIDAIEEFKVESNSPPAEFGRFNGGVVNLTTKAGSNAFHGDAFEFFRDETFFFVDYQGQRQSIGRTVTSTVPTQLQRQGVFTEPIAGRVPVIYDPATTATAARTEFANQTIPLERMDPVAAALLNRYPLPTSGGTANNYSR